MKHLKLFFAFFAMLALGVTNAWGETATLAISSSVTANGTLTDEGGNSWSVTSDGSYNAQTKYIQVGTNKKTVTYLKLSTSAFSSKNISKIQVWATSKASTKVTAKVYIGGNLLGTSSAYATQNADAGGTEYSVANTNNYTGDILVEISRPTAATGAIYFNKAIVTYTEGGSTQPTLSSVEILGDLNKKIYEEGDELDLAGLTVNAIYDDASTKVVTNDVEWSYTPNPLTQETTSVDITASYEEKTVTKTITGLTVNEHIITPGEYDITLNNVFFGTTAGTNISSFPTSAKQDDITVTLNGSGTKTRTDAANVRMYSGNTLTFSVPVGYVIKSIKFTEPTSDKKWEGSISASVGTYNDGTQSWSGNAQSVVFSMGAQNRIAKAIVTYVADVKSTLTIETPQNGTISVKDGATEVATGTQVSAGTSLVVTPTPNTGYVFESLTVDGSAVELTDGTYTFNMPAADVTIAATFKENEKSPATLTLSKNGVTEDITGYKQDDKVVLPSITSDCVKAFVGWSADDKCATEPEYKADEEYTLTETAQTLYAVYATVGTGGEATASVNMATYASANSWGSASSDNQKQITINSDVKAVISEGGNSGKYYNDGVRIYQSESATVTISTTVGELKSVKFTFTNDNDGTLLYGSTKLTTNTAVEVSGTSAVFSVSDTHATENKGQIRFTAIEVVYTGGVFYSNYSTTCVAALDEPEFSVEGGENEAKTITLTATKGTIYYTLDGSTPTVLSEKYTTPIVLDECGTTTIKAIAISSDSESPIASATYTINLPITNTEATAYTPAEAIAIIDGACDKTEEVYVKGVVVSTSGLNTEYGNYDKVIVKAVDDESVTPTEFTFFRLFKAAGKTKFTASDEVIGVGDIITAKGKLTKYSSTYELAEGCYLVSRVANVKADAGLAWNPETVTLTVGDAFTTPTLNNPHSVDGITYESSNEAVATVSAEGVIALVDEAVGTATITASFPGDATYKPATVTCTIQVNPVQEDCEGSDDFETLEVNSSYTTRTTTGGWKATNAAVAELEGYNYIIINGKTSTVGTITSPELNGGIGSIKIRYANTYSESNGVSFRLDIKQDGEVVKTYTITHKSGVEEDVVYTELIENINVAGEFQMVFTNLSPSNSTSNKDRVSIGRLCWTGYEEVVTPDTYTRAVTPGSLGTICLPYNVPAGKASGATFYTLAGLDANGRVAFDEVITGELEAGVSYLFQATATEIVCFYGTESVLTPDHTGAMKGTFVDLELTELSNIYYFAKNALWSCEGDTKLSVPANRAYVDMLQVADLTEAAPVGVRRITLGVNGQNTATGVDQVQGDNVPTKMIINGQLFILRGEKMYDAQGKLVK